MRKILMSLAAVLLLAAPAMAEKLSLNAISGYLNSFQTASGEFTQINADGTISTGRLYIKRPGRIRFEYNPPENSLVMAGGGTVAIFDGKSNSSAEQFPLSQTPLNLILERNVNLARRSMVVGHQSDGKTTTVIAQDPEHPEYGNIRLVFTANPIELRQWVITDGGGDQTTVVLGELAKGVTLQPSLFNIRHEEARRQ
ncbi:outer membrane lipoprotein carrier protein LolA [Tropicimonas sp. IMCC6043]|uniref:LolA family protein n=1 Tax=Tropicimonas sp. IMCC6043 TaxID=2510645 RepID=UPI00101CBA25|nr:outer membrane lipoprotein carrier protein LolA [Tropicimonas sp. IMCC6043]RYH09120.1 outer membrane lipoprotein carrier protein LolA [Tropicimonas sp. IMCC6043]